MTLAKLPENRSLEQIKQEAIERIAGVAERILDAGKADNSRRAYGSRMRQWQSFCARMGAVAHPVDPVLLVAWIAEMADTGRSLSTIRQSMAAVRFAATQRGQQSPTDHQEVQRAMAGVCRLYGRPRKPKKAVTLDTLRKMLPKGDGERSVRSRALLLLGWFGALRRSELTALRVGDIDLTEEGIVLRLSRSKTDQSGAGSQRGIPYQSEAALCPVRAVAKWVALRARIAHELPTAPFFRRIYRGGVIGKAGLSPQCVAYAIKARCHAAGIDPREFSGHSLRRGFATEAARRGKRLEAIQHHLRHSSIATTQRYVEEGQIFSDSNPATGMA